MENTQWWYHKWQDFARREAEAIRAGHSKWAQRWARLADRAFCRWLNYATQEIV